MDSPVAAKLQRCKEVHEGLRAGKCRPKVQATRAEPQGRCPLLSLPLYSLRVKDSARSMGLWSAYHRRQCCVTVVAWTHEIRYCTNQAGGIFDHFRAGLGWAGLGWAGLGKLPIILQPTVSTVRVSVAPAAVGTPLPAAAELMMHVAMLSSMMERKRRPPCEIVPLIATARMQIGS